MARSNNNQTILYGEYGTEMINVLIKIMKYLLIGTTSSTLSHITNSDCVSFFPG